MIQFNQPVNETTNGTKKEFKKIPEGYYAFRITKSMGTTSKEKGSPMWYMELDVLEGPFKGYFSKYPARYYQVNNNPVGQSICAEIIKRLVESNEGMVDPDIVKASTFDESTANGLIIGGRVIITDKGYAKIDSLCSVQYAREKYSEENKTAF